MPIHLAALRSRGCLPGAGVVPGLPPGPLPPGPLPPGPLLPGAVFLPADAPPWVAGVRAPVALRFPVTWVLLRGISGARAGLGARQQSAVRSAGYADRPRNPESTRATTRCRTGIHASCDVSVR